MKSIAEKIIEFNRNLHFDGKLPAGIAVMNPYRKSPEALTASSLFFQKFYNDHNERHIILGINPGRFGSGVTGVAFTDTKRLKQVCNIPFSGKETHEPSSVFVYEMIDAFGGPEVFYSKIYINSVCPLGFTSTNSKGKEVNYNYYDNTELQKASLPFILKSLREQIEIGMNRELCFCFGTGRNEAFLRKLNQEHGFFNRIIALEHPRFIVQYKSANRKEYIQKYLDAFSEIKSQGQGIFS